MKKGNLKKLRLSRETLRDLETRDFQKVVGGMSPISWCGCGPPTDTCYSGDEAC
jgi:hypothetical protein